MWGGGRAPSLEIFFLPRNFFIFYLKMVSFGAFWVYRKLKHLHDFISCLSTKELTESDHFVEKYSQWVSKQTREGLSSTS